MTHLVEILTALVLGGGVLGSGFRAISRLTRLVDAVEGLGESMKMVARQIGDHEKRIDRLERSP